MGGGAGRDRDQNNGCVCVCVWKLPESHTTKLFPVPILVPPTLKWLSKRNNYLHNITSPFFLSQRTRLDHFEIFSNWNHRYLMFIFVIFQLKARNFRFIIGKGNDKLLQEFPDIILRPEFRYHFGSPTTFNIWQLTILIYAYKTGLLKVICK